MDHYKQDQETNMKGQAPPDPASIATLEEALAVLDDVTTQIDAHFDAVEQDQHSDLQYTVEHVLNQLNQLSDGIRGHLAGVQ